MIFELEVVYSQLKKYVISLNLILCISEACVIENNFIRILISHWSNLQFDKFWCYWLLKHFVYKTCLSLFLTVSLSFTVAFDINEITAAQTFILCLSTHFICISLQSAVLHLLYEVAAVLTVNKSNTETYMLCDKWKCVPSKSLSRTSILISWFYIVRLTL